MPQPSGFDYIIIGAGSAGCVLANRLSADPGCRVLLLEAGGRDRHPLIHIPIGFGMMHARRMFDWGYDSEAEPGLNGRSIEAMRGKVLGGSSSINVGGYTRGDRGDYERWARNGATGWGWRDVLPYFKRSESWIGGETETRGGSGPLSVEWADKRDPVNRAWMNAVSQSGYAVRDDVCAGESEGFSTPQFTVGRGRRSSTATAYLKPALRRPNLVVETETDVSRILFEGSRAVGVETSSPRGAGSIRATREVIVCAGAFNSPKLLMLSGIGPGDDLAGHGIAPRVDLPVGENLQDHTGVTLAFPRIDSGTFHRLMRFDRIVSAMAAAHLTGRGPATKVPSEIIGFVKSAPGLEVPDLELLFATAPPTARPWFPGVAAAYPDTLGVRIALLHAKSRGRVTLRSADPGDAPRIRFNLLTDEADLAVLREGVRIGRELTNHPALDSHRRPEVFPGAGKLTDGELDQHFRNTATTMHHPAGTCPIGTVLDPELRVHGVDGLRVVDASSMPDMITGHINAPIIMMAERASDLILGRISNSGAQENAAAPPLSKAS